jgi:type 1 glutamine amidotransferase
LHRGASKTLTGSEAALEVKLARQPIKVLIDYGKGQVYSATPGHVWAGESLPNAVRDVSFQTTLLRATEWLARKQNLYPVPAVFNTETKVAYRDLVLN